jgi:hypothetical protein
LAVAIVMAVTVSGDLEPVEVTALTATLTRCEPGSLHVGAVDVQRPARAVGHVRAAVEQPEGHRQGVRVLAQLHSDLAEERGVVARRTGDHEAPSSAGK